MPAKNVLKIYVENGYYHLYNRGVEKRVIFEEEQDYLTFIHLLKKYLTEDPLFPFSKKSLIARIDLLAYCLMPNHFHLLVKQADKNAITDFIRKICTIYSMYFNQKNKRVGTLFQSRFKASLIDNNEYLLHLSRYIHQNPAEILKENQKLKDYPYSSYPNYLGFISQYWVKTNEIISLLKESEKKITYQEFVESKEIENPVLASETLTLEEVT